MNKGANGGMARREDVPWMPRVADLGEGVNQGALSIGLKCKVEVVNHCPGGCVSQTLPVGWNGIPGVLDLHIIPMYGSRCEVGE